MRVRGARVWVFSLALLLCAAPAVSAQETTPPVVTNQETGKPLPPLTGKRPKEKKPTKAAPKAEPKPAVAAKPAATAPATPPVAPPPIVATPQQVEQAAKEVSPQPKPVVVKEEKPKAKPKKAEYTGPMTVVELAPTPMLDEEGKQRLDPDGKPMFNAPVLQQRDKKGHPIFDEKGKPVMQTDKELGFDEHGKKIKLKKEKPPKMVPVTIERGVMTVDGYTGKAALNYDIPDLKYIYLYAPGIGITVVSNLPFPGATAQPNAFNDKTLTVTVEGHTIQVASEKGLLGKKKKPETAYVLVDRDFTLPSKFPVMGYGPIRKPPYAWPGAKANKKLTGTVEAPPLPKNLVPVQLLQACPTGQMRMAGPPVLPGQVAPVQPCVPIPKAGVVTKPAATPTPATAPAPAKTPVAEEPKAKQ